MNLVSEPSLSTAAQDFCWPVNRALDAICPPMAPRCRQLKMSGHPGGLKPAAGEESSLAHSRDRLAGMLLGLPSSLQRDEDERC